MLSSTIQMPLSLSLTHFTIFPHNHPLLNFFLLAKFDMREQGLRLNLLFGAKSFYGSPRGSTFYFWSPPIRPFAPLEDNSSPSSRGKKKKKKHKMRIEGREVIKRYMINRNHKQKPHVSLEIIH